MTLDEATQSAVAQVQEWDGACERNVFCIHEHRLTVAVVARVDGELYAGHRRATGKEATAYFEQVTKRKAR